MKSNSDSKGFPNPAPRGVCGICGTESDNLLDAPRICQICFEKAYNTSTSSKHYWDIKSALSAGSIDALRAGLAAREAELLEWIGDFHDSVAEKLPYPERSAEALKWSATPKKPFLVLHALTDHGKTRILSIHLLEYFRKTSRTPVIFWAGEVGTKVAAAWRDGQADALTETTKNAPFLAFDDLDKNTFTNRVTEFLFAVTDHRMRHGLPMIITTNLTGGDFEEILPAEYGPSLCRRWREYGKAVSP